MPNAGIVVIEMRLGSSSRHAFMLRLARVSSVVQPWPGGGTYCRSSSQIGQALGGASVGAYCVPQVVQMKAGMILVLHSHAVAVTIGSRAFRPPPMNNAAMAASRHSAPDSMKAPV